jgi:hypothetical protein
MIISQLQLIYSYYVLTTFLFETIVPLPSHFKLLQHNQLCLYTHPQHIDFHLLLDF